NTLAQGGTPVRIVLSDALPQTVLASRRSPRLGTEFLVPAIRKRVRHSLSQRESGLLAMHTASERY
ncbi:MAG: hypothetical protein QMB23_02430, partial [Candidatus Nanopelagicales bacterium]